MKLRKYHASELDPRSIVAPIKDVERIVNYINNICKSDMSDKDKIELIKYYMKDIK